MKKIRFRRLIRGAVVIVVLQVLRLILVQVLPDTAANAASFLTVFLSILMVYIFLIAFAADNLGGNLGRLDTRRLHIQDGPNAVSRILPTLGAPTWIPGD